MQRSYYHLTELQREVPGYSIVEKINKGVVVDSARKYNNGLIRKLLTDKNMMELFFAKSVANLTFMHERRTYGN